MTLSSGRGSDGTSSIQRRRWSLRLWAPSSAIEENYRDPLVISSIEEPSQGA